jgi:Na+/melibiose symporter-like transporter
MVWDSQKIPAQFIPMMFGIPLLFCGVVALNPHRRKASMQVAASVAVLGGGAGVLWCVTRCLGLATGLQVNRHGLAVIAIMSLLCAVFVVLWVRSFFQMQRRHVVSTAENNAAENNAAENNAAENNAAENNAAENNAAGNDAAGNNGEIQNLSSDEDT